ncbi:hypothetical protein [Heyndrickxia acidicola]|uniref:Uncharacterized protein n=1 Tax=Heyndrickxia acidicola TaxID=209389 RepID=A0ABU6MFM8_9BACI|nr:hypothetical protein [Heyndrickxia acidicola]MED1203502.1 hypothetical protein [Heyndrickxia acidicola]
MSFLVGVKEAGNILGWDRRKVSTYHLRGVLPKPVVDLSSGPIWFRNQIEYFKIHRELHVTTYYIKNKKVYECRQNSPLLETRYSPDEVKKKGNIVFLEEDIAQIKKAVTEKSSMVQFFSFELIRFLVEVGILEPVIFDEYLIQCPYEKMNLAKKGMDEPTC